MFCTVSNKWDTFHENSRKMLASDEVFECMYEQFSSYSKNFADIDYVKPLMTIKCQYVYVKGLQIKRC